MARQDATSSPTPSGFEGGLAGLGLADLVQITAQNRFSGCFRLEHEGRLGVLFFRDGEIVHAEVGHKTGEEAFCELLTWPRGRFTTEPNVVTTQRTIQKSCEHLLLDAHRCLDEKAASERGELGVPRPAPPPAPGAAALDVVRALPGVAAAVMLTSDGQPTDGSYESEALAGQAAFVAMFAAEVGALLRVGELRSASVQGSAAHLLLYTGKPRSLAVAVQTDHDLAGVDAAARRALAQAK